MRLFDRVLLSLYTFVIFVLALCLLGISIGLISLDAIADSISSISYGFTFILITSGTALIFIIVSLRLFIAGLIGRKPASSLLKETEMGSIRVSVNTLDVLAQKAVRSFSEIKDVKTFILIENDGIRVRLKVSTMPDVKMPELTLAIQAKVKEYVEEYSGILVKAVHIYVDNQLTATKSRVE
ncbi:MAG TPA: alkaline shock response membrane anchor protein AmaP [Candidatus Atribacteria bacterium]|nr:alkaline shock response membrane anchor protein AmaP [Candidatus Atribacteria bacterium]HPT77884.1 alkaline shock response membrane anchor protein AmaP [Candidatus Atribacteria bacterium]